MSNFEVAAVISNHCVLQRNKIITIFGYGAEGKTVKAELYDAQGSLLDENTSSPVEWEDGKWFVQLGEQTAQTDCSLKVSCGEEIKEFSDIAIGEVWLAGGQSNMEFELQNCTEGPDALKEGTDPNVRFYYTNKLPWMDEGFFEAEKNTCWQTWESQWKTAWSAVGFFFAKKLAADLGVTVGVIGCNWGGTSASAWMSKNYLEEDRDLNTYLTEYDEATKGKSVEQQCAEYDAYVIENDEWQAKCAKIYSENPDTQWNDVQKILGPCPWPGPKSCKNPYRPSGLYETMLHRIIPYTMKGVIWYQGESDDHKPDFYFKLFTKMIQNWRDDWKDKDLPFVFVQLPGNRYVQDKDYKNWCLIREAQAKVDATVYNSFMVAGGELGVFNDIHPKGKKVLAERMENTALTGVYGAANNGLSYAPVFRSSICKDGNLILSFDNMDKEAGGFVYKEDKTALCDLKKAEKLQGNELSEEFTGFEIAGADKIYVPAEYEICGDKIKVFNKSVSRPVYARYAWYNYCPMTIFTKAGLPLTTFRTDVDDQIKSKSTEHAEIQQIMTVNTK